VGEKISYVLLALLPNVLLFRNIHVASVLASALKTWPWPQGSGLNLDLGLRVLALASTVGVCMCNTSMQKVSIKLTMPMKNLLRTALRPKYSNTCYHIELSEMFCSKSSIFNTPVLSGINKFCCM